MIVVFLSAHVTNKIDKCKKDVASSNIATVEYFKSVENELNEKIEKVISDNGSTIPIHRTAEEIQETKK